VKRRLVGLVQKHLLNPPIRAAFELGVLPPSYALLETRGRTSGRPRRTPVGNGLVDRTFWIVAEHGRSAGYVRNIEADPQVRVRVRRGGRAVWLSGVAHTLPGDDIRQRQRLIARGHPGRALNAIVVRTMGTDLLTVRVDPADPADW
jgi:deazaflavin-dependent oxidoreductase (nitroreductase family)